jgi:hypothetical protein
MPASVQATNQAVGTGWGSSPFRPRWATSAANSSKAVQTAGAQDVLADRMVRLVTEISK